MERRLVIDRADVATVIVAILLVETLSSFILEALLTSIVQRRDQQAFIARGLASAAKAHRTGRYVSADEVLRKLGARRARAAPGRTR
jgi:predicted transcriptional regulator